VKGSKPISFGWKVIIIIAGCAPPMGVLSVGAIGVGAFALIFGWSTHVVISLFLAAVGFAVITTFCLILMGKVEEHMRGRHENQS
jgi:uncharacterized membrane protein YdfJ with MMPL/SSD domain